MRWHDNGVGMKKIMKVVALGLSLLASVSVCYAQDFDKGLAAYQIGDYATALREWRLLAGRGDVGAQFNLSSILVACTTTVRVSRKTTKKQHDCMD